MTDKEYEEYLRLFKDSIPDQHGYILMIFSNHDGQRGRYHIASNLGPYDAIKTLEEYIEHLKSKITH